MPKFQLKKRTLGLPKGRSELYILRGPSGKKEGNIRQKNQDECFFRQVIQGEVEASPQFS